MKKGKFVVLEGTEGSGKSTLIHSLEKYFENVITTREPGGTPFAEILRGVILSGEYKEELDPFEQFAIVWAARSHHMRHLVIPFLQEETNVISDRFDWSTFAFQVRAVDRKDLFELFFKMRDVCLQDYEPDLYILLDLPVEIGLRRMRDRGDETTIFDEKNVAFHELVRKGYHQMVDRYKKHSVVIDARQSAQEVFDEVSKHLEDLSFQKNRVPSQRVS
jgi:dTMP kinase